MEDCTQFSTIARHKDMDRMISQRWVNEVRHPRAPGIWLDIRKCTISGHVSTLKALCLCAFTLRRGHLPILHLKIHLSDSSSASRPPGHLNYTAKWINTKWTSQEITTQTRKQDITTLQKFHWVHSHTSPHPPSFPQAPTLLTVSTPYRFCLFLTLIKRIIHDVLSGAWLHALSTVRAIYPCSCV